MAICHIPTNSEPVHKLPSASLLPELQVLVYSHLSGRWVRVREFGPDNSSHAKCDEHADGADAPGRKSCAGERAAAEDKENGSELADQSHPPRGPNVRLVQTLLPGDVSTAGASRGQEQGEAGHAEEQQHRMDESIDWAGGTPVSARFMRLKVKPLELRESTAESVVRKENVDV